VAAGGPCAGGARGVCRGGRGRGKWVGPVVGRRARCRPGQCKAVRSQRAGSVSPALGLAVVLAAARRLRRAHVDNHSGRPGLGTTGSRGPASPRLRGSHRAQSVPQRVQFGRTHPTSCTLL
jgi:hypothetical protein